MIGTRSINGFVKRKPVIVVILVQFLLFCIIWQQGSKSQLQRLSTWYPVPLERVFEWGQHPEFLKFANECHSWRNVVTSSCPKLFRGERVSLNYSYFKQGSTYFSMKTRCGFQSILQKFNCDVLKLVHGYVSKKQISEEEKNFPLAFTIKMHKSTGQAEQILRNIYRPHNIYCVYIDKKASPLMYNEMKQLAQCFDNVIIIEDRISVVYGSILHITSEIQCMEAVWNSNVTWKYYINLTGQEFPLKTNKEMVEILKSLHGANDIESAKFPSSLLFRLKYKFNITESKIIKTQIPKDEFSHDIQFRKGSAYGAMSRGFVDFVLHSNVSKDLIVWLSDTLAPEETVWSTLNAIPGAPGGTTKDTSHSSGNFMSRAMIWQWDKEKCQGKFVRSVCVFGVKDLMWLRNSPKLIANKFNEDYDPLALDCMEKALYSRHYPNSDVDNLNWFYYRNLPQSLEYNNFSAESEVTSMSL